MADLEFGNVVFGWASPGLQHKSTGMACKEVLVGLRLWEVWALWLDTGHRAELCVGVCVWEHAHVCVEMGGAGICALEQMCVSCFLPASATTWEEKKSSLLFPGSQIEAG